MCFVNDYDWFAEICEITTEESDGTIQCCECWGKILKGDKYQRIYMQEHEECSECDGDLSGDECEHHYGESVIDSTCLRCDALREAVKAVEQAEGCAPEDSEPCVGELFEAVESMDGWADYALRARAKGLSAEEDRLWTIHGERELQKIKNG